MATVTDVRSLLQATSLPTGLVDDLLAEVSPIWLMGEHAESIAGDLVLCHPSLADAEVRATVHPTTDAYRLSVVSHDRPGLLAHTAAALTNQGLSIVRASVNTWPRLGLALQRVFAVGDIGDDADWDGVAADLRTAVMPDVAAFRPTPPVEVVVDMQGGGRTLVRVRAPDGPGLLWAITSWMAQRGCNIEVARVSGDDGFADDTFIVVGDVDADGLTAYLAGRAAGAPGWLNLATWPARVAVSSGRRLLQLSRR